MSEIKGLMLLFSLLLFAGVIELVRRKHLREKYSLIWLVVPIVLTIISIWPGLLERFSSMFGVYYPPSLGFIIGIMFLLLITLMLSVVVSHHSTRIITLIQEQASLENRIRKLESNKASNQKPIKPEK